MDPDQNDNDSQLQSATASDAELVAAVSAGDESAFQLLFERHRRRVGAIAGRFFQQHEQIEEIVQECFAKAYFALGEFSHYREGSFQSWLARIAFNSGNFETAFKAAAFTVSQTYKTHYTGSMSIGPECCVADVTPNGARIFMKSTLSFAPAASS